MTPEGLLLRGGTVLVMDDAFTVRRADVRVRGGRIAEVAPELAPGSDERVVDVSGQWVLPGFVHTHLHLCQTLFRNLADDLPLLEWLSQRIWPLEASHTPETLAASAELGVAELLLGGATGLVDMGTVHHTEAVFEVLQATGIRAVAGKCMMDEPGSPDGLREGTEASLRESVDLARRWHGASDGRIRYGFAPRFVLSCTDGLLRDVAAEADRLGAWVHSHAAENRDEMQLVRRRSGGAGNIAHLAALGIEGPRTVLAHGIHLDADEPATLARAGTRVSHCPSSNLKLGSGIADVTGLGRAGAHVSLGADGAPCNNRLDMFTEMRTAALLQKVHHGADALAAREALRMATRSGAEAMGLGGEAGVVEPGRLADLATLELDPLRDGPEGDPAARIVYAADRHSVRNVVVDGQLRVDRGELVDLDAETVRRRAVDALADCRGRAGL